MGWTRRILVLMALLLAALPAAAQQAPTKYALVIGNAAYRTPGWELVNPVNDATLIAQRLRALGFTVDPLMNATKAQMDQALLRYGEKMRAGGASAVGVFYYAGHGVEHDGANLLIPVDVTARTMDELRYQAPPMQYLLRDMARAGNAVNIIVLDACRNLPLPSGVRAGPAGGLADFDDVPDNVLIAYATRPGRTAPDNPGDTNSIFTRTLSEALGAGADAPVESLFATVQARVFSATGGTQRPEFRASLLRAPGWRFASAAGSESEVDVLRRQNDALRRQNESIRDMASLPGADSIRASRPPVATPDAERQRRDEDRLLSEMLSAPQKAAPVSTAQNTGGGARAPGSVFRDCAECPEMVVIPAGSFVMGSAAGEVTGFFDKREEPQRQVSISSFAAGRFELTVGEWTAFAQGTGRPLRRGDCSTMQSGGWKRDGSWKEPGFSQSSNHPVSCVNKADALAYVQWMSRRTSKAYRLLSEAEWEYVARAGTSTAFPWGNAPSRAHANYGSDFLEVPDTWMNTSPVGSFPPNAFGLFDTHGNVAEWVEDCYIGSYANAPTDGSAVYSSANCWPIYRGGSWASPLRWTRSATRLFSIEPDSRGSQIGFRIARTL